MFDSIFAIADSIVASFLHVWPYLLVTIPLAVAVQMSGASRYIRRAFQARPIVAIFLATAVGAFSPFCSCSVVPVVASLLIGGVPLAPVMSFWIASPSMDPEAFFLSVAMIGWQLALWRLVATLALSLAAGLITHWFVQRGWLGEQILRSSEASASVSLGSLLGAGWRRLKPYLASVAIAGVVPHRATPAPAVVCCSAAASAQTWAVPITASAAAATCAPEASSTPSAPCNSSAESGPFMLRLWRETRSATWMVVKFMLLAFFLSALIQRYVPSEWIAGLLGGRTPWSVVLAAILGVPAYTSNLTALPLVGSLLDQGMNPAAALAFLIAGPTTTLPAMAAVWGLTTRRVFVLYVSFSLIGAVVLGFLYALAAAL